MPRPNHLSIPDPGVRTQLSPPWPALGTGHRILVQSSWPALSLPPTNQSPRPVQSLLLLLSIYFILSSPWQPPTSAPSTFLLTLCLVPSVVSLPVRTPFVLDPRETRVTARLHLSAAHTLSLDKALGNLTSE